MVGDPFGIPTARNIFSTNLSVDERTVPAVKGLSEYVASP